MQKVLNIYYIRYITIKKFDHYENIYSVNPLYLIIGKLDGHIDKNNGNKGLVVDSTDGSKKVLKKYREFLDAIKNEIKTTNDGEGNSVEKCAYSKDFMKIKFNTDNSLLALL